MNSTLFGHTLRILRTSAGISLREMARDIHVSPSYLSQLESGRLSLPTHKRIEEMAGTLGIPAADLFALSDRPHPEILESLRSKKELGVLIRKIEKAGLNTQEIGKISVLIDILGRKGLLEFLDYGLSHPSEFNSSLHKGDEKNPKGSLSEKYKDYLPYDMIFRKQKFSGKSNLFKYMAEKITESLSHLDRDWLFSQLLRREEEMSSGLGKGLAVPHLFHPDLSGTRMAVCVVPGGMAFDSVDEESVYLVCIILSHPEERMVHLGLLAHLARRGQDVNFIPRLIKSGSKKEIRRLLFPESAALPGAGNKAAFTA